nr:DUF418 domain-containing protein [Metabacillus mangrovi]
MKKGWFGQKPPLHLYRTWMTIAAVSGPAALAIKSMPLFMPGDGVWMYLHQSAGGPLLSFFYITAILLAVSRFPELHIYRYLALTGRASMSNYLLQSIVCTLIFYSYGLGLYGKWSSLQAILAGITVYLLLASVSSLWFKHYRQGPAERWWRWFIYQKR